jgi:hypothetical protein
MDVLEELAIRDIKLKFMLGDLLDSYIAGTPSIHIFEKRLALYQGAQSIERQASMLLLIHQKIYDKDLRLLIETKIAELYKQKKTYSLEDFHFLLSFSTDCGTKTSLSEAFVNFDFDKLGIEGIFDLLR